MSEDNKLFDILTSCIGPTPVPYVFRIYIYLLTLPSCILPSDLRTRVIQTAVNDRFKSQFAIDQIRTLTNLIAMNLSFVRRVFVLEDLTHNNLTVDTNHISIDALHDLILLSFTNSCIYCQKTLTLYDSKAVRIIDYSKIMRAIVVMKECKGCKCLYGHSSFSSLKHRRRYITQHSINNQSKLFYLCDSLGFATSVLHDYACQLMNNQSLFNAFIRAVLDRILYEQPGFSGCLESISLTKIFQSYWIIYNIIQFELMLGKSDLVTIPDSLHREELEHHFEYSSG